MYYASSLQKSWPFSRGVERMGMVFIPICFVFATQAMAQSSSELDKTAFPLHVQTDFSFAAHRSDTMNATDFGAEYGLTFATWAGKKKNIGLALSHRQMEAKFSQVGSFMKTSWTDATIYFRYLWFYPFVNMGHCLLEAKRDGASLTDSICSTAGGGLDLHIPAGSNVIARLGMKSTAVLEIRDRLNVLSAIGPVQQFDAGVDINPKLSWMTLSLGFRYRSYTVQIDETYKEIETGPFVGIDLHQDF